MRIFWFLLLIICIACNNPTKPSGPLSVENSNIQSGQSSQYAIYVPEGFKELSGSIPGLILDLKYATNDNFVGEQMYDCPRCLLRNEVANSLLKVHQKLRKQDLGLKLFDCYRPVPIQQKLWDKVPDARYVTPPAKGSMHNRGQAIDLTIVDNTGLELPMGSEYDYFGPEAYHDYKGHSETINNNRKLLKDLMEINGFRSIRTEWWHYSYTLKTYPLSSIIWECE